MNVLKISIILLAYGISPLKAQQIVFSDPAMLFMPGIVSSPNADVKITFSPDGSKMLWGGIGYIAGKKDLDIWMSEKKNLKWSIPERVTFDTDSDEFDPSFAPDGSGVYFFSNRKGGFGGDDIYFTKYNSKTKKFELPVNLGPIINTPNDEWTPVVDPNGKYLYFSSNGHGGFGGQDLFKAKINLKLFGKPVNLGNNINGPDDDFDLAILKDGSLIFTSSKGSDKKADLYFAAKQKNDYKRPGKLPALVNSTVYWTFGPSLNPNDPGFLFFSSHLPKSPGRTDIYKIKYTIK